MRILVFSVGGQIIILNTLVKKHIKYFLRSLVSIEQKGWGLVSNKKNKFLQEKFAFIKNSLFELNNHNSSFGQLSYNLGAQYQVVQAVQPSLSFKISRLVRVFFTRHIIVHRAAGYWLVTCKLQWPFPVNRLTTYCFLKTSKFWLFIQTCKVSFLGKRAANVTSSFFPCSPFLEN